MDYPFKGMKMENMRVHVIWVRLCVNVCESVTIVARERLFLIFYVAPFIVLRGSAVRRLNQMQNHPIH